MFISLLFILSLLSSFPSPAAQRIEQAFLSADAAALREILPRKGTVIVSLPDPLSFSDIMSDEQAFLLFNNIFASNRTVEFKWDKDSFLQTDAGGTVILKARWAFRSAGRGTLFIFSMFFLTAPDREPPDHPEDRETIKVLEIRAERL